jgi:hypothetical protein
MIEINTNQHEAIAAFAGVSTRTFNKTFAHAANSALLSTRAFILKAFVEKGLKRKQVASKLFVFRANQYNLSARLCGMGNRIPLSAFTPLSQAVDTPMGRRTSVSISQDGQRRVISGGFLVVLKSGHVGIFKRVGSARIPIKELFSRSVDTMFNAQQGLPEAAKSFANDSFKKNFARDFEYYKAKEK